MSSAARLVPRKRTGGEIEPTANKVPGFRLDADIGHDDNAP
jgi:hypothetical protein